MSELSEIQMLEEQGFRFVGIHFKDNKTIIIEMEKEGKIRSLSFPGSSISRHEFAELFVYIGKKIAEIEKAAGKLK